MDIIRALLIAFDAQKDSCTFLVSANCIDDAKDLISQMSQLVSKIGREVAQLNPDDSARMDSELNQRRAALAELRSQVSPHTRKAALSNNCQVHVKNLPFGTSEEKIKSVFGTFGDVVKVDFIVKRGTRATRAFVTFSSESGATAALGYNGKMFGNLQVGVELPRSEQRQHAKSVAPHTPAISSPPEPTGDVMYPVIEYIKGPSTHVDPADVINAVLGMLDVQRYVSGSVDLSRQTPQGWAVRLEPTRKFVNMKGVYDKWTGDHSVTLRDGQFVWVRLSMCEPPPVYDSDDYDDDVLNNVSPVRSAPPPYAPAVQPALDKKPVSGRVVSQPRDDPKPDDVISMSEQTLKMFQYLFASQLAQLEQCVMLLAEMGKDGSVVGVRIVPKTQGTNSTLANTVRSYFETFCSVATLDHVKGTALSCGNGALSATYDKHMERYVVVRTNTAATVSMEDVRKAVQYVKSHAPVFLASTAAIQDMAHRENFLNLSARAAIEELGQSCNIAPDLVNNGWNVSGYAKAQQGEVSAALNRYREVFHCDITLSTPLGKFACGKLTSELNAKCGDVVYVKGDQAQVSIASFSKPAVQRVVKLLSNACLLETVTVNVDSLLAMARQNSDLVAVHNDKDKTVFVCGVLPLDTLQIPMSVLVDCPLPTFEECLNLRTDLKPKLLNMKVIPDYGKTKVEFTCPAKHASDLANALKGLVPQVQIQLPNWPPFLLGSLRTYARSLGCTMQIAETNATLRGPDDGLTVIRRLLSQEAILHDIDLSSRQISYINKNSWFAPARDASTYTRGTRGRGRGRGRGGYPTAFNNATSDNKWRATPECPASLRKPATGAAFTFDPQAQKIKLAGWDQAAVTELIDKWTEELKVADNIKNLFREEDYAAARDSNTQLFEGFLHWCVHMNKQEKLVPDGLEVRLGVVFPQHQAYNNAYTTRGQHRGGRGGFGGKFAANTVVPGIELSGEINNVNDCRQILSDFASTFHHTHYQYTDNVNDMKSSRIVARWWRANCDVDHADTVIIRTDVPLPSKGQVATFSADISGPVSDVANAHTELTRVIEAVKNTYLPIYSPASDLEERVRVLSSVHGVEADYWTSKNKSNALIANITCAGLPANVDAFVGAIKTNSQEGVAVLYTIMDMPDVVDKTMTRVKVKVDYKRRSVTITGPPADVQRAAAYAKKVIYAQLATCTDEVMDVPPTYYALLKDKRVLSEFNDEAYKKHRVNLAGRVLWQGSLLPQVYSMKLSKGSAKDALTVTLGLGDMLQWRAGITNKGSVTDKPLVDAIVDPANGNLSAGAGLSKVLVNAGGSVYKNEMLRLTTHTIPVTGVAVQTSLGDLENKAVIHAVGPRFDTDCNRQDEKAAELVELTVVNILAQCDAKQYTSLAMPAISSGVFGCPAAAVAEGIGRALAKYAAAGTGSVSDFSLVLQGDLSTYKYAIESAVREEKKGSIFERVNIQVEEEDSDSEDEEEVADEQTYAQPVAEVTPITLQFEFLDDGGWTKFEHSANAACNKAYKSGEKTADIMIPSKKYPGTLEPMYRVNFETKKQINLKTKFSRDVKWSELQAPVVPESAQWQYYASPLCNDLWVDFLPDDNKLIEKSFSSCIPECQLTVSTSTYGQRKFKVDLVNMCQTSLEAKNDQLTYPVRRVVQGRVTHGQTKAVANVVEYSSYRVALYGRKEALNAFTVSNLCDLLKSAPTATTRKIKFGDKAPEAARLNSIARQYRVEIQRSEDGKSCTIFGHFSVVRDAEEALEKLTKKKDVQVWPRDWTHMDENTNLLLENIPSGSTEFARVQTLVNKTSPLKLVKLERVQNKRLYKLYRTQKEDLEEHYKQLNGGRPETIVPMELFHGTRAAKPANVYNDSIGFDQRFCTAGMWGIATYFAVNASYSVPGYSYKLEDGTVQCFLAEVLTGHSVTLPSTPNLKSPPENTTEVFANKKAVQVVRYDSVNGSTAGSIVYMLYQPNRAYPRYLMTLKSA